MKSITEIAKKIDVTYIFPIPFVLDLLLRMLGTSGFFVYLPQVWAAALEIAGVVCVVIIIVKAIRKLFKKK